MVVLSKNSDLGFKLGTVGGPKHFQSRSPQNLHSIRSYSIRFQKGAGVCVHLLNLSDRPHKQDRAAEVVPNDETERSINNHMKGSSFHG